MLEIYRSLNVTEFDGNRSMRNCVDKIYKLKHPTVAFKKCYGNFTITVYHRMTFVFNVILFSPFDMIYQTNSANIFVCRHIIKLVIIIA